MSEFGPEMVVSVPKGWLCPVCKSVYAPFMTQCTRCGEGKGDTTSSVTADAAPPSPEGEGMGSVGDWVDVFRTCGKCGGRMQWNKDIALTSLPAKWEYRCVKCGNVEYEEIGTAKPAYQITLNGNTVM